MMVGTSREMVNRSFHQLEDEGIISLTEDHNPIILDPRRLSEIVEEG